MYSKTELSAGCSMCLGIELCVWQRLQSLFGLLLRDVCFILMESKLEVEGWRCNVLKTRVKLQMHDLFKAAVEHWRHDAFKAFVVFQFGLKVKSAMWRNLGLSAEGAIYWWPHISAEGPKSSNYELSAKGWVPLSLSWVSKARCNQP